MAEKDVALNSSASRYSRCRAPLNRNTLPAPDYASAAVLVARNAGVSDEEIQAEIQAIDGRLSAEADVGAAGAGRSGTRRFNGIDAKESSAGKAPRPSFSEASRGLQEIKNYLLARGMSDEDADAYIRSI